MDRTEAKEVLAEIRANTKRLASCPAHHFPEWEANMLCARLGEGRARCSRCGGEMRFLDIARYREGYMAAGGNPEDVCPGWSASDEEGA